ncbi:RNA-binding RNA processing protein [Saccharomycopsis crataegensis]|uniref:Nucleolar protein 9 n=1 Tax=Saccharomycopsis crataegensis TaxID=43959 RepID=A0AAV5QU84_9ASCO|nr:RNA-binding RNA processing protein [Saccharomycopsis crataegensis]
MAKKVRGRRSEKPKKSEEAVEEVSQEVSAVEQSTAGEVPTPFYGLVDSAESSYFKEAESTMNLNMFENDEDKKLYVNSVFMESKGKELKLVTNQICSKLIERLILNGDAKQIKGLFRSFSGHFVALAHHKYASHCLETLFIRAASLVEQEILGESNETNNEEEEQEQEEEQEEELYASMESIMTYMVNEYKPYLKEMISHQYASHVLRVLLLILAGKELPSTTVGTSVLRSKKSKVARKMIEIKDNSDFARSFQIPAGFKEELAVILNTIKEGQTTGSLRNLAIEKIASPVIQLIIQIEGMVARDRPFYHIIFFEASHESDQQEGAFVEYLLSDAVGSHFLEAVVKYGVQKNIDRLYKLYMKDRIDKLVRRQNTGIFVVEGLLFKLGKGEAKEMLDKFIPDISELLDINLDLGKAIIDASAKHNNYKQQEIIDEIIKKYSDQNTNMVEGILKLSTSTLGNTNDDWPTAEERWRALFFEKLVDYDARLLNSGVEACIELPQERLIQMCYHGVFSHVVESVLKVDGVDTLTRRRLLNQFLGHFANLSCNAYGSHVVDKFWDYTVKMTNYKEKICGELLAEKEKVKESTYGRLVWKNWKMDMFIRKRSDWKYQVKEQEFVKYPPKTAEEEKKELEEKVQEEKKDKKRPNVGINSGFTSNKKPKVRGRNRTKN